MSGTLRLTREGFGIELLPRGQFDVSLDGAAVGSLAYGETFETPVEPGQHSLRIRAGRYSSGDHTFDATDGETVSFRCHGAMVWPRMVATLVLPGLGISLKRI